MVITKMEVLVEPTISTRDRLIQAFTECDEASSIYARATIVEHYARTEDVHDVIEALHELNCEGYLASHTEEMLLIAEYLSMLNYDLEIYRGIWDLVNQTRMYEFSEDVDPDSPEEEGYEPTTLSISRHELNERKVNMLRYTNRSLRHGGYVNSTEIVSTLMPILFTNREHFSIDHNRNVELTKLLEDFNDAPNEIKSGYNYMFTAVVDAVLSLYNPSDNYEVNNERRKDLENAASIFMNISEETVDAIGTQEYHDLSMDLNSRLRGFRSRISLPTS